MAPTTKSKNAAKKTPQKAAKNPANIKNSKSPTDTTDAKTEKRIVEYCKGLADEFNARLNRVRFYVPEHKLTSGTANESILRSFLAEHTAGDFEVAQGFICDIMQSQEGLTKDVSNQCDILVYNRNYFPPIHSEGAVKVIYPEAANIVIEVKTKFRNEKEEILDALENIEAAKQIQPGLTGMIFAFESCSLDTLTKHLRTHLVKIKADHRPDCILLLEQGLIVRKSGALFDEKKDANLYKVHSVKDNHREVVVAFLLLYYLTVLAEGRYGWAQTAGTLIKMCEAYTTAEPDMRVA